MKRLLFLVLLLPAVSPAQPSHWASPDDKTAQWMIAQERLWASGPCDHNRVAETILADDFQGTGMDGTRYTKSDDLAGTGDQSHSAAECKLIDAKVRFFADNLAIVYGSESRVLNGVTRAQVWTDTWLKRNGKWQIIAAQDGRLDAPAGPKASTDSPLQFLLASAAGDFHAHSPHPAGFRHVRFGEVTAPDGAKQYLLCGEFLPAQATGQGKWTPFATIKTSGYEQWLGDTDYCRRPNIVWNEEDLSPVLQSRFDALQ